MVPLPPPKSTLKYNLCIDLWGRGLSLSQSSILINATPELLTAFFFLKNLMDFCLFVSEDLACAGQEGHQSWGSKCPAERTQTFHYETSYWTVVALLLPPPSTDWHLPMVFWKGGYESVWTTLHLSLFSSRLPVNEPGRGILAIVSD